jgi:hypothetical protein
MSLEHYIYQGVSPASLHPNQKTNVDAEEDLMP